MRAKSHASHSLFVFIIGIGFMVSAARAADPPTIEQLSNPASQSVGKKLCGKYWIPYSMPCTETESRGSIAPVRATEDPAVIAAALKSATERCDRYPPLSTDYGKHGIPQAGEPDKQTAAALQPWIDIGKARGLKWGCRLGSLDSYIHNEFSADACARGDFSACQLVWWNNGFIDSPEKYESLSSRMALLRSYQDQLKLPDAMKVSEADCAGLVQEEYLRYFGDKKNDNRMNTAFWLNCAVNGKALSWGLAVPVDEHPCKGSTSGQTCQSSEFMVNGKKVKFREIFASAYPQYRKHTGVLIRATETLGKCDNRIAVLALANKGGKNPWTKRHLEMIRENCEIAAVTFSNPDVVAFARATAEKLTEAMGK